MRVKGIDASYYYAKDLPRATAFYTWLIGKPPDSSIENIYAEWTFPAGESFGLYKAERYAHCDGIMFAVDDVAAALDDVARNGGKKSSDEIEETPVCYMGFAEDCEGNGFILHHHK
jgi:predicted enzyme related to lactoylglutathione lyase